MNAMKGIILALIILTSITGAIELKERIRAKHYAKQSPGGVHGNTQYVYQTNQKIDETIPDEGDINLFSVKMPENARGRTLDITTVKKNSRYTIVGKGGSRLDLRDRPGREKKEINVGVTKISESRRVKRVINYSENVDVRLQRK